MAFEVSIINRKWSDYISLPVDETEQNRILKMIGSVNDTQFKIGHCKEIPELNGAAFAENASFAELNFLAKRIDDIGKEDTVYLTDSQALVVDENNWEIIGD